MALSKFESTFQRSVAREFPNLIPGSFSITSPKTPRYNCIAWATGDDSRWWWPLERYWPNGSPKSTSIGAFVMMFGSFGYAETPTEDVESGFEKVAIYANSHQQVTHAARQLQDGRWTSKLGPNVDISHTLKALEGGSYGFVVKLLKRLILQAKPDRLPANRGI